MGKSGLDGDIVYAVWKSGQAYQPPKAAVEHAA